MLHATWTSLWARKVRLLLSALSIVLGVAFVSGSLLFTNLLSSSFDSLVKGALADVNVSAEGVGIEGFDNTTGQQQILMTPEELGAIGAVDGVQEAVGMVSSSQVFPLDKNDRLIMFPGAPGVAMNWIDLPAAGGQVGARIVEGVPPGADDEVVLDPATAARGGFVLGDELKVATPRDGIQSYTLVGLGTYGAGATAGASYLFFTLEEAQAIVQEGQDGFYAAWVQTQTEADPAAVAEEIQKVLPAGFVAETGDALAATIQEQLDVGLGFVNTFLLVFAGIALLVATLLILNTFSILVAQRSRELALLRAIGATRSQVSTSVLTEALVVGVIGATAGLLVGYGLAWAILVVLRLLGIDLGAAVPSFTWQAVVASYTIGILVTVVAAALPARKASRTRPVEAMAAAQQSGPEKLGGLPMVGVAMIEMGTAALVCSLWLDVPQPLIWAGIGAVLLLVGMVFAAVVVGAPLIWLFGTAYRALFGEVGKLARLNAIRQPRRTAATAATLMIGLALVATVAILAASTTTSIRDRLTSDQRGDFTVSPVAYQPFDATVAADARAVQGVETVYEFYRGATVIDGEPVQLTGTTADGLTRASSLELVAGSLSDQGGAAPVVVSTEFAEDQGLSLGQLMQLPTPAGGTVEVLVTGLHEGGAGPQSLGDLIVDLDTYAQLGDATLVQRLVVFAEDGADLASVRAGLDDATSDQPTVVVADVAEFVEARVGQFQQIFSILYALLALAVVISVLGIVNTLGLSVMERTREVGLLRAVGMTRPQLRRMVTLESVMVATLGATLGVVLGVVFGSSLVTLLRADGIDQLVVPWAQLLVFVVVAALFGVLAAVGPARRASRLNVLESIATE
ncbi:ABC transporter permease [Tessaracoccus sp. Z1128]